MGSNEASTWVNDRLSTAGEVFEIKPAELGDVDVSAFVEERGDVRI